MPLLDPGVAKTDPTSGIAGDIWDTWLADTDSTLHASAANYSPCPGTLTGQQIINRKNLSSFIEAMGKSLAHIFSVGFGTIPHGANSVTIMDAAITVNSVICPAINQSPDASCNAIAGYTCAAGSVTIYGNANPSSVLGVQVSYFAVNK